MVTTHPLLDLQGQPFVFRVTDTTGALRPGLSVTAYLETPGPARTGSVAPRSAVIWQAGKSWVYVQTAPEKFARREVALEEPASGGRSLLMALRGGRIRSVWSSKRNMPTPLACSDFGPGLVR